MLNGKVEVDCTNEDLLVCNGSSLVSTASIRSSLMDLTIYFTALSEHSVLGRNLERCLKNVQRERATARRFGHVLLISSPTRCKAILRTKALLELLAGVAHAPPYHKEEMRRGWYPIRMLRFWASSYSEMRTGSYPLCSSDTLSKGFFVILLKSDRLGSVNFSTGNRLSAEIAVSRVLKGWKICG